MVAVLSGNAPLRGVAAGCLGVMIAMIGTDPQTGTLRWTFDTLYLWDGLPLDAAAARRVRAAGTVRPPDRAGRDRVEGRDRQHLQGPVAGREGLLRQLVADPALLVDRRRHRLDPRHQRVGGRLARLWPRAQDREGRAPDLRQGRRARRDRVGKLEQRQGGRRAGADRRVRRARQRHHGDPARRLPDPRPGARPRHADQESQHHLFDGVVGGAGQHPGRRSLLRVQPAIRPHRDAALHADPPGGARHRLYRRVRGDALVGRPLSRCCSSAWSAGS